jgi:hypothetical protein
MPAKTPGYELTGYGYELMATDGYAYQAVK